LARASGLAEMRGGRMASFDPSLPLNYTKFGGSVLRIVKIFALQRNIIS
jgi:hypothetical protein